jgi:7-carboxy-7-deazaguanine synthase (Cx14CxxC type)
VSYRVKEIFFSFQGEGANTGRPAVFCRFSGCNLWSGREADRRRARCRFCDTDFVGTDGIRGGDFTCATELAAAVAAVWNEEQAGDALPFVVCTGGEPLLQVDEEIVHALHDKGFEVAIETNGTRAAPPGIDWICVSPKAGEPLVLTAGDELKFVYPQNGAEPDSFEDLDFRHFFLQPLDGSERDLNLGLALAYCAGHPRWRISLQTHKLLGAP